MKLTIARKLSYGLKFGFVAGVGIGIAHVAFFIISEKYQQPELRYTILNLFNRSTNDFTFCAILFSVPLILIWIIYDRLGGLLLAGLVTAFLFLPVAYLINKKFLPGFFETISLVGNGMLAAIAAVLTLVVYKRWASNLRFIEKFGSQMAFWPALVLFALVNIAFRVQPNHQRLQSASPRPEDLVKLFDRNYFEDSNGFSDLLKSYFEKKLAVRRSLARGKIAPQDSSKIIAHADSILNRRFSFVGVTHTLPQKIDWRKNPTTDYVWLFSLNRQEWLWDLAAAYLLTGETKYARDFETILTSWFEENSPLNWKNESDPVWRLIDSSLRITSSWLDAFTIFFFSPEVSEATKWRMLASIHDHAQFLMHFRSPGRNHLLQETYGLMAVAGVFPEFKMANAWLSTANFRLDRVLQTEIYPDGGYNEGSTFYHRFVIRILQQIADFADENGVKLSDYFYQRLQEMYTFLMYLSWPDATMPQINDGFHAKNLRILYEKPAQMFNRDDFTFFASEGKSGKAPAESSIGFPYSGIYVMRSDWSDTARYLIVDAGLFGSSHGHEDKLSFELFAFGKPFIIESGTYTYVYNRWHRYFEGAFAHNTIVVDDKSQLRYPYESRWVNDPPQQLPNIWISNERLDYLESNYDEGYGNNKENIFKGIVHTRRILFVKPDYWILWDGVSGNGAHSAEQLFHFPAEPNVNILNERDVYVDYPVGPGLVIKTLRSENVIATKVVGVEEPIQGWISPEYGNKVAAPVISFAASGELPQVFVNVLYPVENAAELHSLRAEWLPVNLNDNALEPSRAVSIKLQTTGSTDYILIAPGVKGVKRFGEATSSAELLLLRTFSDGKKVREEVEQVKF